MKFKTVVRERFTEMKQKKMTTSDRFIISVCLLIESVLNTFIPFMAGYYLSQTERLYWFIPFFLALVISVRFTYKRGQMAITIMRNIWR